MLFNSFIFAVCFPLIFIASYLCPARWRLYLLLLISYALYLNWVPVYLLIMLWVTLVSYLFAQHVATNQAGKNKCRMYVGATLTLLPLLFFKYYDFANRSLSEFLAVFGFHFEPAVLHWAAPIGISFFTLQAYGYLADVYYKRISCERNMATYALFIAFFPQIASGPISKANDLIPQFKQVRPFDQARVVAGLKLLLWGLFMKVVVADRTGMYVDSVYANYTHINGLSSLFATFCYSFQLYGDFAGYSFMAIGVAKMLGFDLINNFNRPFFSTSITELWHRWHIALSIWLRDYVYIPLGGSRCSKLRNYWNIMVTFLVSGIWHGANWTFVVWGMIQGGYQILEKMFRIQKFDIRKSVGNGFHRVLRILLTFTLFSLSLIFFRMPSVKDAWIMFTRMFTDFGTSLFMPSKSDLLYMGIALSILLLKESTDEFFPGRFQLFDNQYWTVRWATYLCLVFLILVNGVLDSGQFIYVNF